MKTSSQVEAIQQQNRVAQEQADKLNGLPVDVIAAMIEILYRKHGYDCIRLPVAISIADKVDQFRTKMKAS